MYFDAVDDEKNKGADGENVPTKEKIQRDETALFKPDNYFVPSKAITWL